jgi:glycerol-3-phosphate O-acyltransferase
MLTRKKSVIDLDWARQTYAEIGRKFIRRNIGEIRVHNLERVSSLGRNSSCLYVANHQTALDYFVPTLVMLEHGLPFGRSVAGTNLNHWIVRTFVYDLRPWGVIWHDRNNTTGEQMRKYIEEIKRTYKESLSVLVFADSADPQGGRDRRIKGPLREFESAIFVPFLKAQRALEKDIQVVGMALDYDKIPEQEYYKLMDNKSGPAWARNLRKYGWDTFAFLRWKYAEYNKSIARVNFSVPVPLRELASKDGKKSKKLAKGAYELVKSALDEIREA